MTCIHEDFNVIKKTKYRYVAFVYIPTEFVFVFVVNGYETSNIFVARFNIYALFSREYIYRNLMTLKSAVDGISII